MTEPLKFSIAAQLKTLRESITSNLSWPSPETEFARTVLSNFGVASHYEFFASQRDLGTIASRMQEAPILAAVGFGVSNADTKSQELWAKSVERLTTREMIEFHFSTAQLSCWELRTGFLAARTLVQP